MPRVLRVLDIANDKASSLIWMLVHGLVGSAAGHMGLDRSDDMSE
jgi:hypothetical protein